MKIGITFTSALFMSIGQVLVMPAAIVADYFVNKYVLPWPAFVGIGLIIISFAVMNIGQYFAEKKADSVFGNK